MIPNALPYELEVVQSRNEYWGPTNDILAHLGSSLFVVVVVVQITPRPEAGPRLALSCGWSCVEGLNVTCLTALYSIYQLSAPPAY